MTLFCLLYLISLLEPDNNVPRLKLSTIVLLEGEKSRLLSKHIMFLLYEKENPV